MQNSPTVTLPLGRQHPAPSWEEAPQPGHYLGPDGLFLKENWQLLFKVDCLEPSDRSCLEHVVKSPISTVYTMLLGGRVSH